MYVERREKFHPNSCLLSQISLYFLYTYLLKDSNNNLLKTKLLALQTKILLTIKINIIVLANKKIKKKQNNITENMKIKKTNYSRDMITLIQIII